MPNHTLTPWVVNHDDDPIQIGTVSGEFIGMTLPCNASCATDMDYANAEFIVRAVNSHDSLVHALDAMICMTEECAKLGIRYSADGLGYVKAVLAEAKGETK